MSSGQLWYLDLVKGHIKVFSFHSGGAAKIVVAFQTESVNLRPNLESSLLQYLHWVWYFDGAETHLPPPPSSTSSTISTSSSNISTHLHCFSLEANSSRQKGETWKTLERLNYIAIEKDNCAACRCKIGNDNHPISLPSLLPCIAYYT